jgi:DNA-binding MarR family transcriptional regulator
MEVHAGIGAALRRAWIGYQVRLDEAMAAAGFDDRRFPDGRVLRMCSDPAGTTISHIGRQLGITRQGAGKIVAALRDRGYVEVGASMSSGREKTVTLTPRATAYLAAHRKAARRIERQLHAEIGPEGLASLSRLLDTLGGGEELRRSEYLQRKLSYSGDPPRAGLRSTSPPSPAATQQALGAER